MIRSAAIAFTLIALIAGCGQSDAPEDAATTEAAVPLPEPNYDIPMRNFAPAKIGPYEVQPMFEEEIVNGHYNIKVSSGGDFNAVRIWVGHEDPADTMVVKCELENDYQHGHLDVPNPIPADIALWIEIEDTEGNTHLGSTPLKQAS